MSEILSGYKNKITNFDQHTREGLILLTCIFLLAIFNTFISNYINIYWLFLIILDLFFYSIVFLIKFSFQLSDYFSLGTNSIYTTNSLVLRLSRTLIYALIIQIFLYQRIFTFYNLFLGLFISISFFYVYYAIYLELCEKNNRTTTLTRLKPILKGLTVLSALIFLGLLMRFYNMYSIFNWDEGWYADISARILQTHQWFIPLYFDTYNHTLDLFDKPPLLFIIGALEISVFGYSTLAIKFFIGLFSGLIGLCAYLIFNHRKDSNKFTFIEFFEKKSFENEGSIRKNKSKESGSYKKNSKFVGIIFGSSMAVSWFLISYGRTAYFDASIVAFTAFTALFAVKSIDHWFYGNKKRAYLYIFMTAFVNMLDLLAKAWQGLIVGPAIAIYLFYRYSDYFVPHDNLVKFVKSIKSHFRRPSLFALIMASFSYILTLWFFRFFIPQANPSLGVCSREYLSQALSSTCKTFVPNLFFSLEVLNIDLWSLAVGLVVFLGILPISDLLLEIVRDSSSGENNSFQPSILKLDRNSNIYVIYSYLGVFMLLIGAIGAFIATSGFEFFYSRFYRAFTEFFQVFYFFQTSIPNLTFFGEIVNGLTAVILTGLLSVLVIWLMFLFVIAIFDVFCNYFMKKRLLLENLFSNVVLEWILLVPLLLISAGLIFWVFFFLFGGFIFNRIWYIILPVGIGLSVVLFAISLIFVKLVSPRILFLLNKDNNFVDVNDWITQNKQFLKYLTITSILLIISFIPFLAWIQFMDQFIVNQRYVIRIPGSLVGSGIKQGSLTYTWLFFDYYIGWRYTEIGGSYPVGGSFGWITSPLFIACLPFFVVGIYGYIKRKDFATLLLYVSWLFTVLFTFLPAQYQLDYYYLAIFFPYFAISSEGLYWSLRKEPSFAHFTHKRLKIVLGLISLFLVFNQFIFIPYIASFLFLNRAFLYIILVGVIFIIGGFVVISKFLVRSIPEIISLSVIIFFLYSNLLVLNQPYLEPEFLIISSVLIGILIFSIRDNMPLRSALFLFILLITPVSFAIRHSNQEIQNNPPYQEIGQFILNHGGNQNGSTWVLPDNGSRYAMRFYLGEVHLVNDFTQYYPFNLNSSQVMELYLNSNLNLKFFIVNSAPYYKTSPISIYSNAYLWLKNHFILADSLVPIPQGQIIHLFVNSSVLSQQELYFIKNNQ